MMRSEDDLIVESIFNNNNLTNGERLELSQKYLTDHTIRKRIEIIWKFKYDGLNYDCTHDDLVQGILHFLVTGKSELMQLNDEQELKLGLLLAEKN